MANLPVTASGDCRDCGGPLPIPRHGLRIRCFACASYKPSSRKPFEFSDFSADWNAGVSVKEIAAKYGFNAVTIYKAAKVAGVTRSRTYVQPVEVLSAAETRANQMIQAYGSGLTLEQIGKIHGVTRERVRQIIAKRGVTSKDGGQTVTAAINRQRRQDGRKLRIETRCMKRLKCSASQVEAITGSKEIWTNHATRAYLMQVRNAGARGIEFLMTFPEWWSIWQQSGHWHQRGRGQGYVMARNGDIGPYAIGNVRICTQSENSKESFIKTPASVRAAKARANGRRSFQLGKGKGWVLVAGLRSKPYQVVVRKKYIGMFATPEEAHAAYVAQCDRVNAEAVRLAA